MIIYLVPSKALASEVEAHIAKIVNRLGVQIVVSSLYGGTDWGPTDAWLSSNEKTVLICTYEKAEALIRFLGPMFLNRVSLVIIDEAHSVQFDDNWQNLYQAESRPLRLEVLGSRLLRQLHENNRQVLALSAVASGLEDALASWASGISNTKPTETTYRSTRQLVGRLECLPNRKFEIYFDLLDGESLQFQDGGKSSSPFILNPFPPHPPAPQWLNKSAEIRIRPHLLWAAMQLASPDSDGNLRSVLISVSQNIGGFAEDFLRLLESTWQTVTLPKFFTEPTAPQKISIWQQCLKSCADYFTKDSREYRLLQKGIIVHHGKMPGLLARLLVQCIQEKIASLVLATSTLSEGVNLPFGTILIPTLRRYQDNTEQTVGIREFNNLIGRAGRPGFGTEGRSLVLLPEKAHGDSGQVIRQVNKVRKRYFDLITQIRDKKKDMLKATSTSSKKFWHVEYLPETHTVEGDVHGQKVHRRPDPGRKGDIS
ncbi:MAG: DEAD/DEAH box helicase [Ardenticatenaceae bacterium]|nr:DEAD/DEAH box helicase [Ardenticatenaceae bacterium]